MANIVFIATSLDGFIAGEDNTIDWLEAIPNPDNIDMGYAKHFERIDAVIMGRNTFELVMSFDCEWPYTKPVFVLSNHLKKVPQGYEDKVTIISGDLTKITQNLKDQGFEHLYIDGGKTIQSFLKQDLIDEMIITTIPILLGGGISLFGSLDKKLEFRCTGSEVFANEVSQHSFKRHRV